MNYTLSTDGFEIHRRVLSDAQLTELRSEADVIAAEVGSACVRHLRTRSAMFDALSYSSTLLSLLPGRL